MTSSQSICVAATLLLGYGASTHRRNVASRRWGVVSSRRRYGAASRSWLYGGNAASLASHPRGIAASRLNFDEALRRPGVATSRHRFTEALIRRGADTAKPRFVEEQPRCSVEQTSPPGGVGGGEEYRCCLWT